MKRCNRGTYPVEKLVAQWEADDCDYDLIDMRENAKATHGESVADQVRSRIEMAMRHESAGTLHPFAVY